MCDPILGRKLDPGIQILGRRLNRAGFRGREFDPKQTGSFRILSLGDSCTFGVLARGYVPLPYPRHLEWIAAERSGPGRVEVLNAGMPGYDSSHGVVLLLTKLRGLEPDLITVRYGWNDLLMSATVGRSLEPPGRFARAAFEALLRSSLYTFVSRVKLELLLRYRPAQQRAQDFLEQHQDWTPNTPLPRYRENLKRIARIADERGAEVWFLTAPINPSPNEHEAQRVEALSRLSFERLQQVLASYNDAAREVAAELGVPIVDLEAVYRQHAGEALFLPEDIPHPTQAGHDLEAAALYERLLARGMVSPRPRKPRKES